MKEEVRLMCFSSDNRHVMTVDAGNTIFMWDFLAFKPTLAGSRPRPRPEAAELKKERKSGPIAEGPARLIPSPAPGPKERKRIPIASAAQASAPITPSPAAEPKKEKDGAVIASVAEESRRKTPSSAPGLRPRSQPAAPAEPIRAKAPPSQRLVAKPASAKIKQTFLGLHPSSVTPVSTEIVDAVQWDESAGRLISTFGRFLVIDDMDSQQILEAHATPIKAFTVSGSRRVWTADKTEVKLWDLTKVAAGPSSCCLLTFHFPYPDEEIYRLRLLEAQNKLLIVSCNMAVQGFWTNPKSIPSNLSSRVTLCSFTPSNPSLQELSTAFHSAFIYSWTFLPPRAKNQKVGKAESAARRQRTESGEAAAAEEEFCFYSVGGKRAHVYGWKFKTPSTLSSYQLKIRFKDFSRGAFCGIDSVQDPASGVRRVLIGVDDGSYLRLDPHALRVMKLGNGFLVDEPAAEFFKFFPGDNILVLGNRASLRLQAYRILNPGGFFESKQDAHLLSIPHQPKRAWNGVRSISWGTKGCDVVFSTKQGSIWHMNGKQKIWHRLSAAVEGSLVPRRCALSGDASLLFTLIPDGIETYSLRQRQSVKIAFPSGSAPAEDPAIGRTPSCLTWLHLDSVMSGDQVVGVGCTDGLVLAFKLGNRASVFEHRVSENEISCLQQLSASFLLAGTTQGEVFLIDLAENELSSSQIAECEGSVQRLIVSSATIQQHSSSSKLVGLHSCPSLPDSRDKHVIVGSRLLGGLHLRVDSEQFLSERVKVRLRRSMECGGFGRTSRSRRVCGTSRQISHIWKRC